MQLVPSLVHLVHKTEIEKQNDLRSRMHNVYVYVAQGCLWKTEKKGDKEKAIMLVD